MQLPSVRALKAEILARLSSLPGPAPGRPARDGFAMTTRTAPRHPGLALGIAAGTGGHDYRLAVRLRHGQQPADAETLSRIEALAAGEVDIRYTGRIAKLAHPSSPPPPGRTPSRPLHIGMSVGHVAVTAGTLGLFASDRAGRLVLVSNNHVLADEDRASLGDFILQPGPHDGGNDPADRIAALLAAVPLHRVGANLVDAAAATLEAGTQPDLRAIGGFGLLAGLREPPLDVGDRVRKLGRTTHETEGVVTAIELDGVEVDYDKGVILFDRQIEIEGSRGTSFSAGGDSGSLIVDDNLQAVGLLFAGSEIGGTIGKGLTYANEIGLVLEALQVELALSPPTA